MASLEEKVLSCHEKVKPKSIGIMLGIPTWKVGYILRKHGKIVRTNRYGSNGYRE